MVWRLLLKCCFKSTETVGLLGTEAQDSTFTKLFSSGVWRSGKRDIIYLLLHYQHQNDACIKVGSDERHFNGSLIVRDNATNHLFEVKGEPKRYRTEALLLTNLTSYHYH